jgi:hypothetical protein
MARTLPPELGSLPRLGVLLNDRQCPPFGSDTESTISRPGCQVFIPVPCCLALSRGVNNLC